MYNAARLFYWRGHTGRHAQRRTRHNGEQRRSRAGRRCPVHHRPGFRTTRRLGRFRVGRLRIDPTGDVHAASLASGARCSAPPRRGAPSHGACTRFAQVLDARRIARVSERPKRGASRRHPARSAVPSRATQSTGRSPGKLLRRHTLHHARTVPRRSSVHALLSGPALPIRVHRALLLRRRLRHLRLRSLVLRSGHSRSCSFDFRQQRGRALGSARFHRGNHSQRSRSLDASQHSPQRC
jgi:hypothetical protein